MKCALAPGGTSFASPHLIFPPRPSKHHVHRGKPILVSTFPVPRSLSKSAMDLFSRNDAVTPAGERTRLACWPRKMELQIRCIVTVQGLAKLVPPAP